MKKMMFLASAVAMVASMGMAHADDGVVVANAGHSASSSYHDFSKDVKLTGEIHGASKYQFRGSDFSGKEPSIGGSLKLGHTNGFYGTLGTDTIKLVNLNTGMVQSNQHQMHTRMGVGYLGDIGTFGGNQLTAGLGLQHNLFSGKGSMNDLSFTEVMADAHWAGVDLLVSTNISGSDRNIAGLNKGDWYTQIGYTHMVGMYDFGGDVGYSWYDNDAVGANNGVTLTRLRAGYAFNQNLHVGVSYQFSNGHDGYVKNSGNNQTTLKVSYKF